MSGKTRYVRLISKAYFASGASREVADPYQLYPCFVAFPRH